LEGTFCVDLEGNKSLVIDEVYLLAGERVEHVPKWDRMIRLGKYLREFMSLTKDYRIELAGFYQTDKEQLVTLHRTILEQHSDQIQGITFWPSLDADESSETPTSRTIWYYMIVDSDLNPDVVKTTTMWLRKTKIPDVYDLLQRETKNKIDIARIPDTHTSSLCASWFPGKSRKPVLVVCHLDCVHNKWVPVSREI